MNEWKKSKLGESLIVLTDYHANGSYETLKQNVTLLDQPDYAIMIRTKNFEQNDFENDLKYISESAYNFLAKSKVLQDDILMNKIASAGSIYLMPKLNKPVSLGMNLFLLRTNKNIANQRFIYYYLKANEKYVKLFADGTATKTITKNAVRNLDIFLPDIKTQEKIVKILSSLEDKIELNRKMNQTLEQIAQAIFKHWFIDFEFPNEAGKPYKSSGGEMVDSELGGIPKGWEFNGISKIVYVQNGYAFKSKDFENDGEIGIIKIKNISNKIVDIHNVQYVNKKIISKLDTKFRIEPGSVLIAMTGAEVAKIGVVPYHQKQIWLNQRVGMFRDKIPSGVIFCYFLLTRNKYQEMLKNKGLGSSAQPNISSRDIESIEFNIPPKTIIQKFGNLAKPLFDKIIQNLYENDILENIRDTLLPKLISGKIRVKTDE